MGFNCGIAGLPNVGKSTLFNALTQSATAEAANYPFCTIEPNVGRVPVPDDRLEKIAALAKSAKTIPTFLEFVDIAGLVRGASKGEGLGNKFLAHIREVEVIAQVLRCFAGEAAYVEGSVDPLRDAETVETELMLAELESVERQLESCVKRARGGEKAAKARLAVLEAAATVLREGRPARLVQLTAETAPLFRQLNLLTAKPMLYIANVDEAGIAALVYPTWTYPPALLELAKDDYLGDNSQLIAPATGMPAATVPMGFTKGGTLPAGLQILGRRFDDGLLIQLSYAYEQATLHHEPPAGFPPL